MNKLLMYFMCLLMLAMPVLGEIVINEDGELDLDKITIEDLFDMSRRGSELLAAEKTTLTNERALNSYNRQVDSWKLNNMKGKCPALPVPALKVKFESVLTDYGFAQKQTVLSDPVAAFWTPDVVEMNLSDSCVAFLGLKRPEKRQEIPDIIAELPDGRLQVGANDNVPEGTVIVYKGRKFVKRLLISPFSPRGVGVYVPLQ